jgi:hypothetical protein
MNPTKHSISSDQEIIFESNEEESVLANPAPFSAGKESVDENLLQSSLNPSEAFQYFHHLGAPVEGRHYFQTSSNQRQRNPLESPWEKYFRLQSELEELRVNLNSIEVTHDEKKESIWSLLQTKTEGLLQETNDLSGHNAWKYIPKDKEQTKSDHTSSEIMSEMMNKIPNNNSSEEKTETKMEMVSSMYQTVSQNYSKRLLTLEKKISYLETLLGMELNEKNILESSSLLNDSGIHAGSSNNVFPIVSTINKLEQKVNLLDNTSLDQLRSKLSSFKHELETISSSISSEVTVKKGDSSSETQSMKLVDIYSKVQSFLEQYSFIQSIIHEIPVIILRLKTLENIHWNANLFKNRLDSLESDISTISSDLHSNKNVLTELKTTLMENFTIMKENIDKIENKL